MAICFSADERVFWAARRIVIVASREACVCVCGGGGKEGRKGENEMCGVWGWEECEGRRRGESECEIGGVLSRR
jgi:hypothetical protein